MKRRKSASVSRSPKRYRCAREALPPAYQARRTAHVTLPRRPPGWSRSRRVDAVVDSLVDARVEGVDLAPQAAGIEVGLGRADAVEGAVEHADDLGQFVVDDRAVFLSHSTGTVTRPVIVGAPWIDLAKSFRCRRAGRACRRAVLERPAASPISESTTESETCPRAPSACGRSASGAPTGTRGNDEVIAAGLRREAAAA